MRLLFALCVLLLCCGFASAQDAWTYPGQYAEPFAPRLSTPVASPGALPTPFLTLDTPPLTVGRGGRAADRYGRLAPIAVDRKVEQGKLARSFPDLQANANRPNIPQPQRRLLADEFPFVPRHMLRRGMNESSHDTLPVCE